MCPCTSLYFFPSKHLRTSKEDGCLVHNAGRATLEVHQRCKIYDCMRKHLQRFNTHAAMSETIHSIKTQSRRIIIYIAHSLTSSMSPRILLCERHVQTFRMQHHARVSPRHARATQHRRRWVACDRQHRYGLRGVARSCTFGRARRRARQAPSATSPAPHEHRMLLSPTRTHDVAVCAAHTHHSQPPLHPANNTTSLHSDNANNEHTRVVCTTRSANVLPRNETAQLCGMVLSITRIAKVHFRKYKCTRIKSPGTVSSSGTDVVCTSPLWCNNNTHQNRIFVLCTSLKPQYIVKTTHLEHFA